MKCKQHIKGGNKCPNDATLMYVWPGKDPQPICATCIPHLRTMALGVYIPIIPMIDAPETAMSKPLLNDSVERQDARGALATSAEAYVAISDAVRVNTLDAYDDARGVVENTILAWQGMLCRIDGWELAADDLTLDAGAEEKP